MLLAVAPGSLHAALTTFTQHPHKTLNHCGFISLGQPLANFEAKPEAAWAHAHVRAMVSTYQHTVDTLTESWAQLAEEATKLCNDWKAAATRRQQGGEVALRQLESLVATCDRAMGIPLELWCPLRDIEASLEWKKQVPPHIPEALVATHEEVTTFPWELHSQLRETEFDLQWIMEGTPMSPRL